MKIQYLILLTAVLLATPALSQETELIPLGEMTPVASPGAGETWVEGETPLAEHQGELVPCPHCHTDDCCKVVPVQEIRWKYVMWELKVTNYQVEETGHKLLKKDICEHGVCTQIDQLIRTKELVPHPTFIKVPGLKPYTVTVPKKLCFKCKRTH